MRMLAAAIGAALACLCAAAQAQDYSPAAKQVLAQARAASGGGAWNTLRGWREVGVLDGVRYELWADPIRYGERVETRVPAGLRVRGFNGAGDWTIAPDGAVTGVDDRTAMAQARTTAFLSSRGYFFPGRFPGKGEMIGVRQHQGRSYDVLRIEPGGGEPRELWFDRGSHLLGRIVDRSGARVVTEELSDYRKVGGVMAPFRAVIDGVETGRSLERKVEAITTAPADRALFSLTRPPGAPVPVLAPAKAAPQKATGRKGAKAPVSKGPQPYKP